MKIIINTYSSAKTLCGFAEKQIDLKKKASVSDALVVILKECGNLKNLTNKLLFAVNEEYCDENKILHDGDQLSIFPPVSGG
jgi:molybdopterin converting factor small subunit